MTRLLGLWGYAGSGKDTAAEALIADGWRREAFADRLRAMLYALDPIIGEFHGGGPLRLRESVDFWGWDRAKRQESEVRELLQRLGTEAGRQVLGENVWVEATMRAIGPDERVVVTDMRFENELRAIREAGGLAVAILRRDYGPVNGHASETALADLGLFDVVIENDGTVADLHARIREAVESRAANSVNTVEVPS